MQAHAGHTHAPLAGLRVADADRSAAPPPPMLEVDSLVLGYSTGAAFTPAVAGMSFAVGQGETAALLGPSGCGKSTILKAVAGFLRAQPGRLDDPLFRL